MQPLIMCLPELHYCIKQNMNLSKQQAIIKAKKNKLKKLLKNLNNKLKTREI